VPERPTIRMVAERSRVSVSTVSRAINGGYVSAETKRRIDFAIRALGYAPSIAAQSLVAGRTGCIGLVASSTQSTWFSQILAGVEEQLASSRHSVLLSNLVSNGHYDPSVVLAWIAARRVDGLIFVRYGRREQSLVNAAAAVGMPVVLLGPDVRTRASAIVTTNNIDAGALAAEHLIALGHQRIAFAGGPRDSLDTRDRFKGLTRALTAAGLDLPEQNVWFADRYSHEAGVEYARTFLEMPRRQRPSAVVLGNDAMALGFMRTVLQHGVKIPAGVSVIGFDGVPEGGLYWPGLTTVLQPAQRMGKSACRALLDALHVRHEARTAELQYGVELIVRESTAKVPSNGTFRP
jgi:LacI family transcriptional regulator